MKRIFATALAAALTVLSSCSDAEPAAALQDDVSGSEEKQITVCIDPGHGFDDVGTDSEYLGEESEKDVTLRIARYLQASLEDAGIAVIMTHDGEAFPVSEEDDGNSVFSPRERISYANTLDVDCFISIHCDSYTADSSVHGTRVYYSKGTLLSRKSASFAETLKETVDAAFPDSKAVIVRDMAYTEAFHVIRTAKVPSVLVETGFVTNETDAANMLDSAWCENIAQAMADAIVQMFAE